MLGRKFFLLLVGVLALNNPLSVYAQTTEIAEKLDLKVVFKDVPLENNNFLAIDYWQQKGVLKGYESGEFKPNQAVNRAEALKIIFESSGNQKLLKAEVDLNKEKLFLDVEMTDWYAKYVVLANELKIISGNEDGTFAPERKVNRAEFLKMLLNTNGVNVDKFANEKYYQDVPLDSWFVGYLNYAGRTGLLVAENNRLLPAADLTRGEVAEIIYIMDALKKLNDNDFLAKQADLQLKMFDYYVEAKNVVMAKRTAQLALSFTQQLIKNLPENREVLAQAKLARAYDHLIDAYILALQKQYSKSREYSALAELKVNEALELDQKTEDKANYVLESLNLIENQISLEFN